MYIWKFVEDGYFEREAKQYKHTTPDMYMKSVPGCEQGFVGTVVSGGYTRGH